MINIKNFINTQSLWHLNWLAFVWKQGQCCKFEWGKVHYSRRVIGDHNKLKVIWWSSHFWSPNSSSPGQLPIARIFYIDKFEYLSLNLDNQTNVKWQKIYNMNHICGLLLNITQTTPAYVTPTNVVQIELRYYCKEILRHLFHLTPSFMEYTYHNNPFRKVFPTYCKSDLKKTLKTFWYLFMDGVQLPQG